MSKIKQLEALREQIVAELDDDLAKAAQNLVFGKGNPDAPILFIGEAPGQKEDEQGIPFVGRAGKELDKFLNNIGLTLDDIYIANVLKYRPPKNRDPSKKEIQDHSPYLIQQIKIIKPIIIATLGNYSTKLLLANFNTKEMKKIKGIAEIHGKEHKIKFNDYETILIPLYHPAAILYRPRYRPELEEDFKIMKKIIISNLNKSNPLIKKLKKLNKK